MWCNLLHICQSLCLFFNVYGGIFHRHKPWVDLYIYIRIYTHPEIWRTKKIDNIYIIWWHVGLICHTFSVFSVSHWAEELNSEHLAAGVSTALSAVMHIAASAALGATREARHCKTVYAITINYIPVSEYVTMACRCSPAKYLISSWWQDIIPQQTCWFEMFRNKLGVQDFCTPFRWSFICW